MAWRKVERTCRGCGAVQQVRADSLHRLCGKCAAKEAANRPEQLEKNRTWHIGRPSGMKGRSHTAEANSKNRAAHIGRRVSVATEFKPGAVPHNRKPIDNMVLVAMYEAGKTAPEIAREVGLSKPSVLLRLSKAGAMMRDSAEILRARNLSRKPEEHPRWKGGATPEGTRIRQSTPYKEWRNAVFTRDNYTCLTCGARGVRLHADHIKPFALFPELRFDVGNGRTLCEPCHKATPTYLRSNLRREDFE